jgi:hypothetical protein
VRRADAEALFRLCDDDGNGSIELSEFLKHYQELVKAVGGAFPRRPDQRPIFEFIRGQPVSQGTTELDAAVP